MKKISTVLLIMTLLITSSFNLLANETQKTAKMDKEIFSESDSSIMPESLLDDPSKLIVTENKPTKNSIGILSFVGEYLFAMNINDLYPDSLLTTKTSGKSVTDDEVPECKVGVYNYLDEKAKIGLCIHDYYGGSYVDVGSTTLQSGVLTGTFSVSFPYATAYGFVRNLGNSTMSGSVSFYSLE